MDRHNQNRDVSIKNNEGLKMNKLEQYERDKEIEFPNNMRKKYIVWMRFDNDTVDERLVAVIKGNQVNGSKVFVKRI
jgi:hypothetical protein